MFRLINKNQEECHDRSGRIVPVMIFDSDSDRIDFENFFENVDKNEIETKLNSDAIMQHLMNEEERVYKGRPCCGVYQIKVCYEVYKNWKAGY